MKCHKGLTIVIILSLLLIIKLLLLLEHGTLYKAANNDGYICLHCQISAIKGNHNYVQEKWIGTMSYGDIKLLIPDQSKYIKNMTNETNHQVSVTIQSKCSEKNCRNFLSEKERQKMSVCGRSVKTKERFSGPIKNSDCRFLPEMGRHPVALVSAEGSGNTWTRGLLERATGICTGFIFCDKVMRAHGYVGENIRSGKVLVVKTHSVYPKWVGQSNIHARADDSKYSSAVFILRNPVSSAIAEWNRRASQTIVGKHNLSVTHERHTYTVPSILFSKLINAWH